MPIKRKISTQILPLYGHMSFLYLTVATINFVLPISEPVFGSFTYGLAVPIGAVGGISVSTGSGVEVNVGVVVEVDVEVNVGVDVELGVEVGLGGGYPGSVGPAVGVTGAG